LSSILGAWRRLLSLAGLCIVASALLELVPPLLLKSIIDDNLALGTTDGLFLLAILYLAATGLAQGLGFATTFLTSVAAQGGLNQLRLRLFTHLQKLPIAFYDRTPLGDVISRCTADVDTVDTLFSSGVVNLVADAIRLITVVIAMISLSPQLSLVTALAAPPLIVITNAFRIRVRSAERANRLAIGRLNAQIQETLRGVEVIQVFHRQAAFVARFRHALKNALDVYNRATVYTSLYPPTMAILSASIIALLLWASTWVLFTSIGISLGTLTAFVLLFQRFFAPISALGEEWQTVQSALSGMERIFQVLSLPLDTPTVPVNVATATDCSAYRDAQCCVRLCAGRASLVRGVAGGQTRRAPRSGRAHGRRQEQHAQSTIRAVRAVVWLRANRWTRSLFDTGKRSALHDWRRAADPAVVQRHGARQLDSERR
jgi:ATP-binding cassette subfamily B protein